MPLFLMRPEISCNRLPFILKLHTYTLKILKQFVKKIFFNPKNRITGTVAKKFMALYIRKSTKDKRQSLMPSRFVEHTWK